jgi:hypothetical protein
MDVRAAVEVLAEMGVRVHCLALGGVDLTSAAGRNVEVDPRMKMPDLASFEQF